MVRPAPRFREALVQRFHPRLLLHTSRSRASAVHGVRPRLEMASRHRPSRFTYQCTYRRSPPSLLPRDKTTCVSSPLADAVFSWATTLTRPGVIASKRRVRDAIDSMSCARFVISPEVPRAR